MIKTLVAILLAANLCNGQGLLEILSPPSELKLTHFWHSKVPNHFNYQVGQSVIGHLHFLETNLDACAPFDADFVEMIAPLERNERDHEESSAMVQNFVLVAQKGGCKLT